MPDASILTSTLLMLLVVVFLSVILFVVKKMNLASKRGINSVTMQILSKLTIQPRVNVYIVKAGDKTLMLGVSDKSISTLADLTPEIYNNNDNSAQKKELPVSTKSIKLSEKDKDINLDPASLSFSTFLGSMFKKNGISKKN